MDSYFKAAVCDLDKLLDEFEQSADEYDCYRTPQNPYDSKHHSLSSVLDCLQHVYPTPKLPGDANNCTSSEDTSLASHTGTSEVFLSYSPQSEKGIAGPDLLSTVDSGSLNETQASNLGRRSVPVCDLVNDTGNLIHSVAANEDTGKLQPDDFQCSESLTAFDISGVPVRTCVSSTEQSDGNSMLQDSGHPKTKEVNNLALKLDTYAAAKASDPCGDEHSTESAKCSEVFDQLEQTACLNTPYVPVTSRNSNAYGPKDENAYEKLPCEPQDESACSAVNKEGCGRKTIEKIDSKDESSVESVPSDLAKGSQLHESYAALPGSCVSPGLSCQAEAKVELEKKITEENVGSEELDSSEKLNTVSPSCISAEDVQTSLSCLPLPVSICGSLAVTEEKVNPLPQNEMEEVVDDILTVHAGKSNMDLSSGESSANADLREQEGYIAKINESIVEKSAGGEKYDTENVIDDSDSQQIKALASAFLEYEVEPYGIGVESYYNESISPIMSDFTVEESVIKSDTLISDAELDDFLYGQSLQSSVLNSSHNDGNLMEADADAVNVRNVNNLDFTEVTEEHMQAKLEEAMIINSHLNVSLAASELESAAEESMSSIQNMSESGSEALVSDIHSEGARPKQLPGLTQEAVGQIQLNRSDVLKRENQEANSVTLEPPVSGTIVNVGKNSDPARSGESNSKAGGNQTPENTESLKVPAAARSWKQPVWVPDSEAPNCMNCQVKFTFTKRRHHCRACGKVFCVGCCKRKCKLQYLEKEARVCNGCYNDINKGQAFSQLLNPDDRGPNSNSSSESSAVSHLEKSQASGQISSQLINPGDPGPNSGCSSEHFSPSSHSEESQASGQASSQLMNPGNPGPSSRGCSESSDVSLLEEAQSSGGAPSPSAVLPISVLKQPGIEGLCPREQRRVWFADGILPNGKAADTRRLSSRAKKSSSHDISPANPDLPEAANPGEDDMSTDINPKAKEEMGIFKRTEELHCPVSSGDAQQAVPGKSETETLETEECSLTVEAERANSGSLDQTSSGAPVSPSSYRALCGIENCVGNDISLVPYGHELPPLLLTVGEKGRDPVVEEHPSYQQVTSLLGGPNPLTFILNVNLLVNVKQITSSSEKCWYFSTNGLHALRQAEIIILLQCLPDEQIFPIEIFKIFIHIYKNAMKGRLIKNMENITFTENSLGSTEHGGFLFVSPTFQKLDDQILPEHPFLYGILIHKLEIPWAKVFPIRLLLRLGAEYDTYPTSVISFRQRKPLFGEIGHTVMDLLVDLRNYRYNLHTIDNLFVHVEMGRSCIKIPLRKYDEVMKVIDFSDDHVISIGASFNHEADSYLVCVQNKHGLYHTQAISATGHPRKVTGASFVVFNGALKRSSGFLAKSSIVEDGLMVQITEETMRNLRQALRCKEDFKIPCGKVDAGDIKEYVDICWVEDEDKTNKGILSPVDGKSMEGTQREKMRQGRSFERSGKILNCTEVYYFLKDGELSSRVPYEFAKEIAIACSTALCPHVKNLKNNGMNKIGLRVSIDSDMVEYIAGSDGHPLPQNYLNELDNALVPVIHGRMSNHINLPLKIELIFFIMERQF